MSKHLTGSQIVCESLLKEGVNVVFGIPGGAILPLYGVLSEYPQLRHILSRHEQGAAHEADGYARSTGRVGVVFATSGPGATNLITGLATAMMDSVPIVAITGQVGRAAIGHPGKAGQLARAPQLSQESGCLRWPARHRLVAQVPQPALSHKQGAIPGRDPATGLEGFDDAGAVRMGDGRVGLHTVDFFPPVVDDPAAYGAIAAANALSDIYACGGQPKVVLNLAGFPEDWDEGQWRRECRLLDRSGAFYGEADGFHPAGAVIDASNQFEKGGRAQRATAASAISDAESVIE